MSNHLSDRQLRERIIDLVQAACSELPPSPAVSDLESKFGLTIAYEVLPIDKEGAFIEEKSKIIVNRLITSDERRQFTLFHELIHYLLRKDDDLYAYLHETYRNEDSFYKTIEYLCNIGAAEILLPRQTVREVIDRQGFSLELLINFCESRQVSGPAALIQLIQYAPNECYGVICEYGNPQNPTTVEQGAFVGKNTLPYLYIRYAIWSPSARYPMARFTRIPSNHILTSGLRDRNPIKGVDRIPFRSESDWKVPCEVQFFRGNVYGLFHASPPPSTIQPRLL